MWGEGKLWAKQSVWLDQGVGCLYLASVLEGHLHTTGKGAVEKGREGEER